MALSPADYTSIVSGGWAGPAVEPDFNTPFTTDMHLDTNGKVALFRQYLESGQTYDIGLETKRTQYNFLSEYDVSLLYWKPSDWPGSLEYPFSATYEDSSNVDVVPPQPESLPYNYPLNYYGGVGGRRASITASEAGYWYFCFYKPPLVAPIQGDGPETDTAPLYASLYTPTYPWDTIDWDLGDGTHVYDDAFFHYTYTIPGVYSVGLTLTLGDETATDFKADYYTVLPD